MNISWHIPPVANDRTSRAVKSGFLNTSTSKSGPHGNTLMSSGAPLTSVSYLALSCLFTMAVNPEAWQEVRTSHPHLLVVGTQGREGWSTFPFSTTTVWIDICLYEPYVALDYGPDILDPVFGGLLMIRDRPCLKTVENRELNGYWAERKKGLRFDIALDHFRLIFISGIFLRLNRKNGSVVFARVLQIFMAPLSMLRQLFSAHPRNHRTLQWA